MDDKKRENKAVEPATENKATEPPKKEDNKQEEPAKEESEPKTVRVQVKPRRAVTGIGGAGKTKRIDSELAKRLEGEGLVTIL